jgi:uncharacterized protein YwqG
MSLSESFQEDSGNKGFEKHRTYFDSLRKPAIRLSSSDNQVFSRLGGLPEMPPELQWPEWNGLPLAFLCQIDLSEIPNDCPRLGLPDSGILYFFYDSEQSTWGYHPCDKGSWRVLYADSPANACTKRKQPTELCKESIYSEKYVVYTHIETYPDWLDERINSLGMSDDDANTYLDLCAFMYQGEPSHHFFGFPIPVISNGMDVDCELVSNGINCVNESGYRGERAAELKSGSSEWGLLFQVDTDEDINMQWGDGGKLYFWIKNADLEAKRFEECWMRLQCSLQPNEAPAYVQKKFGN